MYYVNYGSEIISANFLWAGDFLAAKRHQSQTQDSAERKKRPVEVSLCRTKADCVDLRESGLYLTAPHPGFPR
jgi:hypothetical protein